nr:PREDICTED: bromodomain-containing protein 8-like [Struthio camelus australis]
MWSCSPAVCCEAWAQEQVACLTAFSPRLGSLRMLGNELEFAVLDQGTKKFCVSLYVSLQMGHAWVCWGSETESLSESEKNSDFQSLLSWDSSLDLEVGSWRNTKETAVGELEESSQEEDRKQEFSESLWEDDSEDCQKVEVQREQDSLLQFLSEVTHLMEPLCISSTDSAQSHWDFCGSRTQDDEEYVSCPEKNMGTAVSEVEESQLQGLAEENEKEHFPEREDEAQEASGEQAAGELCPQEKSNQPLHQDDRESTSAASPLGSTTPASTQLVQLSWDNPLQRLLFKRTLLSIWKMIASHRYSGPFLKAVSDKQAPGYKDVVKRPMDLTSIKRNLSKGHIQTSAQFQRDLMLMFQNAVMYNSVTHHVHRMAVEMQQEVLEQLQMLGEALLCSGDRLGWGRR